MRTLLIDNYDSFTFNLFQLLAEVNGVEPLVVRNDEASWPELAALGCDNVVLSPGPGEPGRAADFGVCAAAIRAAEVPLLGVCLGHQGLGLLHGAAVVRAPRPVHGGLATVAHTGAPLFAGIPPRFAAVRYHSLCLARPLPAELEEIAIAEDGVTMAVAHRSLPQWGVQFHPESVAAEHGRRLLENFRDLSAAAGSRPVAVRGAAVAVGGSWGDFSSHSEEKSPQLSVRPGAGAAAEAGLALRWRRLRRAPDPERAFAALYAESDDAFWLDSVRPGPHARFSFMGDAGGALGGTASYDAGAGELALARGGATERRRESIFAFLEREQTRLPPLPPQLPFGFAGGPVGYLGYELKAECGGERVHASPWPDAAFVLAARTLAFDHEQGDAYLLCLHEPGSQADADSWLSTTAKRLEALDGSSVVGVPGTGSAEPPRCCSAEPVPGTPPTAHFRLSRSRDRYLADIAACDELLRAGESYEICLTNRVEAEAAGDSLDLYRRLRRVNPAPFSSYLRFGDLAVLGSSPERFLRLDREGGVEARPIKGTRRRDPDQDADGRLAAELDGAGKDRAENLMIVDLVRNDLGAVCAVGSVGVPALMEVESYETVHQLVSTVRGRLRPGVSAPECVRACFPPGSMTGAPKRRTMAILDELEGAARGVYSGAVGWFGAGGACDLAVAIRTIVLADGRATVGAGGAIVLDSDPAAEFEEMLLKAAAPLRAVDPDLDPAPISLDDPRPATV